MEHRKFGGKVIVRFDKDEDIVQKLAELCRNEGIRLGAVSAIGAISEATVGCFNTLKKEYYSKDIKGILEIASLSGNISSMDGEVYLHLHCVLADENYNTVGGHLNRAVVSATCEMVIDVIDGEMDRAFSEQIGLNLYKF